MKSTEGRSFPNVAAVKKNAGKKHSNNASPALKSKASGGAKVSKAAAAARSNNAKPSFSTTSSSKASAGGKVSKAPSVAHSTEVALKAGVREGGVTKAPVSGERIASNSDNTAEAGRQKLPRQESVTKKKDEVVTKEKEVPSPATSSTQVPPTATEEKTPAAQDVEVKAKTPEAPDKRPSTSSTKGNAKNREVKSSRKKRGHSRGNKAVQTHPEEKEAPAGPPIHVLFSPSSCSLCESNAAPSSFYGAMQPFQVGKYGAVMAAPSVVTTAHGPPRGVVKKTVKDDDDDNAACPRQHQDTAFIQSCGGGYYGRPGKVNNGRATKKNVTTTRRLKDRDKTRKNSDPSSGVERTITETIDLSESAEKRGSAEKQTDGAISVETTVIESSNKWNAASVAPKKIVRTVRRAKNADPLREDDVIETVTTEVVEVESEAPPAQPAQQTAAPAIVGVARDSSATQYRYSESRRLASTPYRAPRRVGAVNQRMHLRPPRVLDESTSSSYSSSVFSALPARSHAAYSGHHGHSSHPPPSLAPMVAHGASSSCPGLAGEHGCSHVRIVTTRRYRQTAASFPPAAVPQSANVRSVGHSSDPSEGTYDVFYEGEPDPVPANAGGIRSDVPRRPTEFIWETPPREELVYCANLVAGPTTHAVNGHCGATCNEDASGRSQDGVNARAAQAVTDLSMTAGSQVASKSAGYERMTSVKTQEVHPRQQSHRLPAQSMVDKATNTILDEAAPNTTKHNPVSSSVRCFASRDHLAIIDQDNSSQDNSEETLNEERFLYRDDITGAGETADQGRLREGAKLKPRKKSHHRSKTVTKDLVFSISPKMAN
ncbi:hypothetical protein MTO96_017166 [Rhipicephalus appendiculatus]